MEKERFIVYGAGRIGKGIVDLLIKKNKYIEAIWDQNSEKRQEYRGIPIINPYKNLEDIEKNKNSIILIGIASPHIGESVYHYLKEKGCHNIHTFFDNGSNYIINVLCKENDKLEEMCTECGYVEECSRLINNNLQKMYLRGQNTSIIKVLSIVLTNRCTMNCQYCAQCTQEIRKHGKFYDMTLQNLQSYMECILKEVSYIHQLALTGGEILLCRELPEILEYLCSLPQVGYIKVLTTATVPMSDSLLKILNNPKIVCWIDDYGENKKIKEELQKNLITNVKKISEQNIIYKIIDNSDGTWYDLGDVEKREDMLENSKKNRECMFRMCLMISAKGIFSWCARNISCLECGLIPDDTRDYCDLSDEKDSQRVKEILELKYLHGCEYCSGTSHNNIVPAGMQIR